MTIQMQEEQKCSSCFFMQLQQPAGKGDSMAKFLNYEDRLDIESGLKEHMTFTELGEKLGRDRTTITKEIRNYSIEQDTGYGSYPHNTCKYRKACRRKKVCGTNDCRHPLVAVCKQCELICNRYCEHFEEEVCTHRFKLNSHPRFPFCKRVSHFESDLQILYPAFHFCNDFPVFFFLSVV